MMLNVVVKWLMLPGIIPIMFVFYTFMLINTIVLEENNRLFLSAEKMATVKLLHPNIVDDYKYGMNNFEMAEHIVVLNRFGRK